MYARRKGKGSALSLDSQEADPALWLLTGPAHSTSGPQFFHLEIGGDWISSFQGPFQPCPLGPSKPSTAKESVTELHGQGKPGLQFMGTVEELGNSQGSFDY